MICLKAYAKINWTLDIIGKRKDGYHEMDMLMQSISLHDTITLEPCESIRLLPANASTQEDHSHSVDYGETNLVVRSAHALCEYTGRSLGVKMTLLKQIPIQAGLGGGSADAAAVLRGLNDYWQLGLSQTELLKIGEKLGADIPFLLTGGFARVKGIGERIESLPISRIRYLVLIQPCIGLSTPEVFKAFDRREKSKPDRPDTDAAADVLIHNRDAQLKQFARNVMEPMNVEHYPAIFDAISDLYRFDCDYAAMSGSGSVVFGSFTDEGLRNRAYNELKQSYRSIWKAETRNQTVK